MKFTTRPPALQAGWLGAGMLATWVHVSHSHRCAAVPSLPWAVLPVPRQALEGPLTASASSWLWIFLPLSNLEDR